MKTLAEIKERGSKSLDGRDFSRLAQFIPEAELSDWGMSLKPEFAGTHVHKEFTREAVLDQLKGDVSFGFEKALNQRGISSSLMFGVVSMWNWALEEGLENYDEDSGYAQYGLPLFKATAIKYGFENPIGNDAGNENKYASA